MTYQEFKQKVDALWEKFWTGGITNPLSVIEQITYLIFLKMSSTIHTAIIGLTIFNDRFIVGKKICTIMSIS